MKFIYVMRHGQTEYNRNGILQGRRIDAPLNKTGRAQARAFYNYYGKTAFDLVITSDLKRSIESVEDFLTKGAKHIVDPRITEFSWGSNEGRPLDDIILNSYKKMLNAWYEGNLDARIPMGESGMELRERVRDFVQELKMAEESNILICTHGRTLKMLVVEMLGLVISEMEAISHSNTALFLFFEMEGQVEMLLNNDTRHLPPKLRQKAFWDK